MTDQTPPPQSVVSVEVSGLTGSGKSAVMGEIEIALKALGLTVEHDAAFQAEKNGTHADWQEALDLYKPTVVLTERNMSRAPAPSSLAGGEVERAARALLDACVADFGDPTDYPDDDGWVASGDSGDSAVTFKHMRDLQAALSPEAPSREGEWFTTDVVEVEYHDGNGETHMSPWEVDWGNVARWRPQPDADPIPKDTASSTVEDDDDASTYAPSIAGLSDYLWNQALEAESVESRCILEMWREAVDAPTPRHEAPAEGAGKREEIAEAVHRGRFPSYMEATAFAGESRAGRDYCFRIADSVLSLRARSSAPEAREGEPVGWRSIDSAPKDGTTIDVWRDEGHRDTVFWGYPHHECGEMGSLCDSDWHSIRAPGWVCNTFNEFLGRAHNPFTHWKPVDGGPNAHPAPDALRPSTGTHWWNPDNDEEGFSCWGDAFEDATFNGWDAPVRLELAKRLPDVWAVRIDLDTDGDGEADDYEARLFDTEAQALAALQAEQKGGA